MTPEQEAFDNAVAYITALSEQATELTSGGALGAVLTITASALGFAKEQPKSAAAALRLLEQFAAEQSGMTPEEVEQQTRSMLRDDIFGQRQDR